jgi:CBS domain-containing protein
MLYIARSNFSVVVRYSRQGLIMLLPCPYCDHEVIEGADECDACGQPLTESHLPVPASAVERALLTDRVSLFQGRQPLTVSPKTTLRECLKLLVDNRVGCLLVEDNGKTIGIFTERDALLKLGEKASELGGRPISEFMTSKVESLPPTAKIAFAVHRMDHGGYRHVPVVNQEGRTVGIFSVRDILKYITTKLAMGK